MTYYRNNKYKEFAQHRVCAIDYYPIIVESLATAFKECKRLGITAKHWNTHSKDTANLLLHYCLDGLHSGYTNCPSRLRKVYAVYESSNASNVSGFLRKNLKKILKVSTLPWCEARNFNDPDLEYAALRAADNIPPSQYRFTNFAKKHNLQKLENKFKKNRIFLNSTVDLSHLPE